MERGGERGWEGVRERWVREERSGGEREGGERQRERRGGGVYHGMYLHIPHIPPYISYTIIYIKIFNIKTMRDIMRHKNGHFSGCRPFPKVRT